MHRRVRRLRPSSLVLGLLFALAAPARADLDQYVKKADPGFKWSIVKSQSNDQGKLTYIKLTSQVWQGIPWTHNLQIYEPAELTYKDSVLLFITGGSIDNGEPRPSDAGMGMALAKLCGSRVAVLPQVPNQPLLGEKKEDQLIAETFVRYLDTKDESWPLLFPMVKSAVKAMDAVQEWSKSSGLEAKKFVVTGASKRGWTTWLTGATDPRVLAIAPMVIDTLNMKAQMKHALDMWGKPSEQIHDYTERGLTEKFNDPLGQKLWMMVDPYTYRDKLSLPKLIINGANDRYWTLDALNLYWDDLKGQKSVVYLPNAGHNLAVNRDYALNGIGAFFRHHVSNRPWPQLAWEHGDDGDGRLSLTVTSTPEPKAARLWVVKSSDKDFRDDTWNAAQMTLNGQVAKGYTARPESGYVALMGDVEYEIDGIRYHLSTQVRQAGAKDAK